MPTLLDRVIGLPPSCMAQRPSRDDFMGINTDSVQSRGLVAWWPTWEPMANAQKSPAAMDYGPSGLHFAPAVNCLHVPDPQMGACWYGQPNPVGMAGMSSGQAQSRPYGRGQAGIVDPVDFGNNPSTTNSPVTGVSYMSTAWCKTIATGQTLSAGTPVDMYIYSFDRNDGHNFPGHSLGAITQTFNAGPVVANLAATFYDNSVSNNFFGAQSLQIINDGIWHLVCSIYAPIQSAGSHQGFQWIMVDGDVGFQGGTDDGGVNAQPFGFSLCQNLLGSPQDASFATVTPIFQVLGADDDGITSPWQGWISDHRLYSWPLPPSATTTLTSTDILQQWQSLAAHMYAPETRWELYYPRVRRTSLTAGVNLAFKSWWTSPQSMVVPGVY